MTSILIADDHSFMRAGLQAVLRGTQYEIVAMVARGDEALTAVGKYDPALCLFDVRMPGIDGIELLELMRTAQDMRPVVLLTAELNDAALGNAVRAGVNGILLKDSAAEDLLACLDAVMRGEQVISADLAARLENPTRGDRDHPLGSLTPRERQIVDLVARGMRNRDVAEILGMSEGTVKVYLHAIYQKLGIDNRTELALVAHGRFGSN